MEATVIQLRAIVDALEIQGEGMRAYLNRQTGEVVIIADEEMSAAEEEAEIEDYPDWQQENIRTAIAILETDHYVELPDQREIDEWAIMRDFCDSVSNEKLRQELLGQIHGKGAFRHFKDSLHRHGIEKQWYRFRDEALERIAQNWLDAQGISYQAETAALTGGVVTTPPTIQPQITAIDHVQLAMPANEEEKARSFYVGILGLQEVPKPPALAKRGGVWFALGSVKVHLGVKENFQPARKAHPAFLVQGWEVLLERCQQAGYSATLDDQIPEVRRAYVSDPFGNRLELIDAP